MDSLGTRYPSCSRDTNSTNEYSNIYTHTRTGTFATFSFSSSLFSYSHGVACVFQSEEPSFTIASIQFHLRSISRKRKEHGEICWNFIVNVIVVSVRFHEANMFERMLENTGFYGHGFEKRSLLIRRLH